MSSNNENEKQKENRKNDFHSSPLCDNVYDMKLVQTVCIVAIFNCTDVRRCKHTHTAEDKRIGNTRNTQGKRKSQRTCEEKQICVNEPFSMCVVHKQHGFQLLAANNNNKISKFQCNHDHYHKYRNIVIHLCIKIHFYILPKFTIHTHARSHLSRILVTIETSPVSCCHAYSLSPVEISWTLLTFHRHFFNALVAYN